jgi:hypothetical protein
MPFASGLLDREVCSPFTLVNTSDILTDQTVPFCRISRVAYEPSGFGKLPVLIDRRNTVNEREFSETRSFDKKVRIWRYHKSGDV